MIELAFVGLLNHLQTRVAGGTLRARRTVAADPNTLLGLLSDPARAGRLAGGLIEIVRPQEPGGADAEARLLGPLGLRRAARIHTRCSDSLRHASLRVELRNGTVGWLTWALTSRRGTTDVKLVTEIQARPLDRLALLLGGKRWLRRQLQHALAAPAETSARAAEGVDAQATTADDRRALAERPTLPAEPAQPVPAASGRPDQDPAGTGRRPASASSASRSLRAVGSGA